MPFVNLEGWVIIGPGSEWFWTAVSGIVVAVTLVGLYLQLRMQRAAAAIEQIETLDREFDSEYMVRCRLAVALLRRDGAEYRAISDAGNRIMDFWARLGYLVQEGHVDRSLVYEWFRGSARMWWAMLGPTVAWERKNQDDPTVSDTFEWLAGLMADMDAKKGRTNDYEEARILARLPGGISALRARLDLAEQLRATVVRPVATDGEMPPA